MDGLDPPVSVAFNIVFYGGTLLKSKTFNIKSMTLKQWPAT